MPSLSGSGSSLLFLRHQSGWSSLSRSCTGKLKAFLIVYRVDHYFHPQASSAGVPLQEWLLWLRHGFSITHWQNTKVRQSIISLARFSLITYLELSSCKNTIE